MSPANDSLFVLSTRSSGLMFDLGDCKAPSSRFMITTGELTLLIFFFLSTESTVISGCYFYRFLVEFLSDSFLELLDEYF